MCIQQKDVFAIIRCLQPSRSEKKTIFVQKDWGKLKMTIKKSRTKKKSRAVD